MANSKSEFGWCRLILYILSAIAAYFIANRFVPIRGGFLDVLLALLAFLALFLFFVWLSRFVCGLFGAGEASTHSSERGLATGAVAAGAAGAGAVASSASASGADADHELAEAEARAKADAEKEAKKARDAEAKAKADADKKAKADADAEAKKARDAEAKAKADADAKAKAEKEKKQAAAAGAAGAAGATAASSSGESSGTMPRNLKKEAQGGKADNLKEIKGIGPKLEKLCHKLGIFHFSQIAEWDADEIEWMDGNLEGFHGRVTRDDWVGQAKILAAGGETEFSQRVEDGKVY